MGCGVGSIAVPSGPTTPTLCTSSRASSFKLTLNVGVGKSQARMDINQLSENIGLHCYRGPFLAYIGCDYIVCSFFGVGKVKWWEKFLAQKEDSGLDEAFRILSSAPSDVTLLEVEVIVRFTLMAYGCHDLFSIPTLGITQSSLPPSRVALSYAHQESYLRFRPHLGERR